MVSTLDLPETFLQAAGASVPADMQGRSLVPLLRGSTPKDWRTSFYYHYYEHPAVHNVAKHYGVVTSRYKLFHVYEPEMSYWEMIDRRTDPREMKNVYDDPAYAKTRERLHAELNRLRTELRVPAEDAPASKTGANGRVGGGGRGGGR
jgi:arylsulfatase A-like enzyme